LFGARSFAIAAAETETLVWHKERGQGSAAHNRQQQVLINNEQFLKHEPAEFLGDWHPLVSQLGSTEGLAEFASLADLLRIGSIVSESTLHEFLIRYQTELLVPVELPTIMRAYTHACGNELREMIAFDQQQHLNPAFRDFGSASRRVGQAQLRRLKPLRDHRFVQRYLRAVDEGRADGWHTIVYGVTLSVYSLPLRQGLLHFSAETLRGFVQMACRSIDASESVLNTMLDERFATLVAEVEKTLPVESESPIRLV
jgi:urease accessory protein UreF